MVVYNKGLIVFFMALCLSMCLSSANATYFLNWSYHNATDNNSYIFIENNMQISNGSYAGLQGNGDVSFASTSESSDLSETYFVTEIWANTSATWDIEPFILTLKFNNEDSGIGYNESWYVYKSKGLLNINQIGCTLAGTKCIYINEMATFNVTGDEGYSYLLKRSATDVSKNLGLNAGWLSPEELSTLLYGWTYENSYLTSAINGGGTKYSFAKIMNSLTHYDQIGEPELLAGLGDTVTTSTLPFLVTFRGYYNPYDLGIAIVDNTTFANLTHAQGYTHILNASSMVAYKELPVQTTKSILNKTIGGKIISIYDMKIAGTIETTDYNKVMTDGTYYLMVFQKRMIYNDYYYLDVAYKEFQFVATGTSLENVNVYTYDMNDHRLINTSSGLDWWLGLYDFDLDSAISNGNIQANYLDIQPYCYKTDSTVQYIYYSVYKDSANANRISVKMNDYNNCKDNKLYLAYGGISTITSNSYYTSNKAPQLDMSNFKVCAGSGCSNSWQIYTLKNTDSFNVSLTSVANSGCTTSSTGHDYLQIANSGTGSSFAFEQTVSGFGSSDEENNFYNTTGLVVGYNNNHTTTFEVIPTTTGSTFYRAGTLVSAYTNKFPLSELATSNLVVNISQSSTNNVGCYWATKKLLFGDNVWTLALDSSSSASTFSFTEGEFEQDNSYTWSQTLNVVNDNTIKNLLVYVDDDFKTNYILQPLKEYKIEVEYVLTNGQHELKALIDNEEITHQVYATNSTLTSDLANIKNVDSGDLGSNTATEQTYTSGNVFSSITNILDTLLGSWSLTPYILSLAIGLVLMFYTRKGDVGLIGIGGSLLVFSLMGWISGIMQTVLIGIAGLGLLMLIYTQFSKVRG